MHFLLQHISFFRLSLYRGLLPVISSLYCSNFVYFYTFNGLKAAYITKNSPETAMVDLFFGFLAGKSLRTYTILKGRLPLTLSCLAFLSRLSVSPFCLAFLSRLSVSPFCLAFLSRLSVSPFCLAFLSRLSVSPFCLAFLSRLSVSPFCLAFLSRLSVSPFCLVFLSRLSVSPFCLAFLSRLSVSPFCLAFLSRLSVSPFCLAFLSRLSVSPFCLAFLSRLSVSPFSLAFLSRLSVSSLFYGHHITDVTKLQFNLCVQLYNVFRRNKCSYNNATMGREHEDKTSGCQLKVRRNEQKGSIQVHRTDR